MEEKFIARIEQKLLPRIQELESNVRSALEQKFGEISLRLDELEKNTEGKYEQNTAELKDLISETVTPRNEPQESSFNRANEQTVISIVRHVKEETNRLAYIVNHPDVFRDGLWSTIQQRFDGSTDFYRNWTEFRTGFGSPRTEYWLGMENLYQILRKADHELLIVLEDFDGVIVHAHYSQFRIGAENERYAIRSLGEYSGTAGDSLRLQKDAPFATYDAVGHVPDRSEVNCATVHRGAWWFWKFPWCTASNLNGNYSGSLSIACNTGLHWNSFRGCTKSLKSSKMMIRPSGS